MSSSTEGARPDWDTVWMGLALTLSQRSTCDRLSVGCVVVSQDNTRVLSLGYNGGAKGLHNCCLSSEPGNCGCFPGNAKVITATGKKRISQIKKGDLVLTHMNRFRTVTNVLKKGPERRLFVLMTVYGSQRFISTVDHPVMVRTSSGIEWRRADTLSVGDIVLHATKSCRDCGKQNVAVYRELCNPCFKISSKGLDFRARASERMRRDNPMKRLRVSHVIDDERVKSLVEKQRNGQLSLREKLMSFAKEIANDPGKRAIVIDHVAVKPDIVLIDWEKRHVTAVEYEKFERGVRKDKYVDDTQYDDVLWHVENKTKDDVEIYNGFACLPVKSHAVVERDYPIYNLEVEDDNSFVCQNIVVHNCLHAETNALIKLNYSEPDKIAYVTTCPCRMCAISLVNAGVREVVYGRDYRLKEGLDILRSAGVTVRQFLPEGHK